MQKGKRIAPQIQRTRSDDLLASVFPAGRGLLRDHRRRHPDPRSPAGREVMKDVLQEAMDLEGLNEVLRGIASGAIRCLAVDTPTCLRSLRTS
jgi:ATP-dependent Lhr-like helicase